MALNPIRWDNIASPQFNNSGYAVAGEAFGEASEGAARFAKSMQEREEKRIAELRANALNEAVARMRKDGKATPEDLIGLSKDVDQGLYGTAYDNLRTTNQNIQTAKDQSTAFQTENERNRQLIAGHPLEQQQAADKLTAQVALLSTQQNTSELQGKQITQNINEQTRIGEKRVIKEASRSKYENSIANDIRAEGTVDYTNYLKKNNINPADTTDQDAQLYLDNYEEEKLNDERYVRDIAMKSGMTSEDFYANTREGQTFAQITSEAIKTRAADEAEKFKNNKATQQATSDYYGDGITGNPLALTIVNGQEVFSSGNKKINSDQIDKLYDDYGLDKTDDPEILTTLEARFPTSSAFKHYFMAATTPTRNGKREFIPNAIAELDTAATNAKTYAKSLLDTQTSYAPNKSRGDALQESIAARKNPKKKEVDEELTPTEQINKRIDEIVTTKASMQEKLSREISPNDLYSLPKTDQEKYLKFKKSLTNTVIEQDNPPVFGTSAGLLQGGYTSRASTAAEQETTIKEFKEWWPEFEKKLNKFDTDTETADLLQQRLNAAQK